jgi:small subunit ribosomal protein S17
MADKKAKPGAKTASTPPPAKKAAGPVAKAAAAAKGAVKNAAGKVADAAKAVARAATTSIAPTAVHKSHSFRRKMVGVVTSDKMDKTVTVEVVRRSLDPVYKKYVRQRNKYKAHDPSNAFKTGDRVEITEHAPISREKRWLVTRLIARRVEA